MSRRIIRDAARLAGFAGASPSMQLAAAMQELGGGGGVAVLGAKYTSGGKELHDGSGHMPRDGSDFYVSRTSGDRLLIDAGYAEGATLGALALFNMPDATITGAVTAARRSGLDGLTASIYVDLPALAGSSVTLLVKHTPATLSAFDAVIDGPTTSFRAMLRAGTSKFAQAFAKSASGQAGVVLSGTVLADATVYYQASVLDETGNATAYVWNSSGTLLDSGTNAGTAFDLATLSMRVGVDASGGFPWDGCVDGLMVFDASVKTQVQLQAIVDALAGGDTVDTVGATEATDGGICGAYDPAAATTLFTISGTGAEVTAEFS